MERIASSSPGINDLWSNPIWNPLDFLAGIILGIAPLIYAYIRREKKELSYIRISDTSLVNINNKRYAEDVKVTYLGVPSKTLQLIRLKIINTGNLPIDKEDFKEPLTFVDRKPLKDGKVTGIFLLDFPEKSQKELKPKPTTHNNRVGIEGILLNQKDSITIDILNIDAGNYKAVLDVQMRVKGVEKIKELEPSYLQQFSYFEASIIAGIIGVAVGILSSGAIFLKMLDLSVGVLITFMSIIISILLFRNTRFFIRSEAL
jgi:hypothetical protein